MKKFTQYIKESVTADGELKLKLEDAGLADDMISKVIEAFHTYKDKFELYHSLRTLGLEGATIYHCFPHILN